jgi:hypothetical protein
LVRATLSDKYLKKWYPLPLKGLARAHMQCLPEKRAHVLRVSLLTKIAG